MATAEMTIVSDPVPLRWDLGGVLRVGPTRVTLDVVLVAFRAGAGAEEIVHQFPTLKLADVYSVIAYSLNHRAEVDAYLSKRKELAEQTFREIDARGDQSDIKARLLARRQS